MLTECRLIACLVPRPHYSARPMRFGSRGPRGAQITPLALIQFFHASSSVRLFEGGAYLREAFIWKSEATKNCINISIFTLRIKLTELTSFDFDYTRAASIIRWRRLIGAALIRVKESGFVN